MAKVISKRPEPNIWDTICKDYAERKPPFRDEDSSSVQTDYSDYDPSKHTPVFCTNTMYSQVNTEELLTNYFEPEVSHPACVGYCFARKPMKKSKDVKKKLPDKETCTPREFLETFVYPTLVPALTEMLKMAESEKCFERKKTKFDPLDNLTENLYRQNHMVKDENEVQARKEINFLDIPFVDEWLKMHPRKPIPLSLLWTEEEAALKLQSFYRGYKVRKDPEVQEMRDWQREWREENRGIHKKMEEFWDNKLETNSLDSSEENFREESEDMEAGK